MVGGYFLFRHPEVARLNWHPFIPPKDAHGNFGWGGIPQGRGAHLFRVHRIRCGIDGRAGGEEAAAGYAHRHSGVAGHLHRLIHPGVAGSHRPCELQDAERWAPVALGIDATGVSWGSALVKIGAVFGLATVMLVMLLGQTRVFYSMSKDGLLWKWASAVHPKFRTPWITTIVFGIFAALFPAFLPIDRLADLVNIGTLLAFSIVCAGVWVLRVRHPELKRPFKAPFVPLVPILGIVTALYLMANLALITWEVMIGWLIFGLLIYFTYSVSTAKCRRWQKLRRRRIRTVNCWR